MIENKNKSTIKQKNKTMIPYKHHATRGNSLQNFYRQFFLLSPTLNLSHSPPKNPHHQSPWYLASNAEQLISCINVPLLLVSLFLVGQLFFVDWIYLSLHQPQLVILLVPPSKMKSRKKSWEKKTFKTQSECHCSP